MDGRGRPVPRWYTFRELCVGNDCAPVNLTSPDLSCIPALYLV